MKRRDRVVIDKPYVICLCIRRTEADSELCRVRLFLRQRIRRSITYTARVHRSVVALLRTPHPEVGLLENDVHAALYNEELTTLNS